MANRNGKATSHPCRENLVFEVSGLADPAAGVIVSLARTIYTHCLMKTDRREFVLSLGKASTFALGLAKAATAAIA